MTCYRCPACGVPYTDHLGLTGTCEALQRERVGHLRRMAHTALFKAIQWRRVPRHEARFNKFASACFLEIRRINKER